MKGLLYLCLLLTSAAAWATPTISSVTGDLADGNALVISGAAFGSKATAAPWKYDDFEGGTVDSALSGWTLAVGDGDPGPIYSTDFLPANSTRSVKCRFSDGNGLSGFGLSKANGITEVYFDAWFLYDPDPVCPSRNVKMLMTWASEAPGTPPDLQLSFYCRADFCARMTQSIGATCDPPYSCNYNIPFWWPWSDADETWVHLQGYLMASSTGADDGIGEVWTDGVQWIDEQAFRTRTPTDSDLWHSVWLGYWVAHNSNDDRCPGYPGPTGDTYTYFDYVYIDSTEARVELGDATTYATCSHREIQIPSAWAVDEITMTVNQGIFGDTDSAYVYVTDSLGVVNAAGYGVLFSGDMPTWQGGIVE